MNRRSAVLIAGANGSGKSTLLKVLCGIIKPPGKSKVLLFGKHPWKNRDAIFKHTAAMYEDLAFPEFATGKDVIELVSRLRRVDPGLAGEYASGLFGLDAFWEEPIRTYSSGMKMKVALAQALSSQVELLILDEPFIALDRDSRRQLVQELQKRKTLGTTIVVASHILAGLGSLIDRIVVMSNGRIEIDQDILPGSEPVQQVLDRMLGE